MTRLPFLRALAASFVRYCARVTAQYYVDQLAERQREDDPRGLYADAWLLGATYTGGA